MHRLLARREPPADLAPDDLDLRDGCAISLRGAVYAASEVVIGPERLVSGDRGRDEPGVQAWGATEGGHEFVRRGSGAPPGPDAPR